MTPLDPKPPWEAAAVCCSCCIFLISSFSRRICAFCRASSSSRARRAASSSLEYLGGAVEAVPLKLVGTVPGGALEEPAKAAADDTAADLGVVEVGVEGFAGDDDDEAVAALSPDLGAAAVTERVALAPDVGDVDLLGGIPKRAMADSAVSLGVEVDMVIGADLLVATEGKLLALE